MAEAVTVKPTSEQRTDKAERVFHLVNAPTLRYEAMAWSKHRVTGIAWKPEAAVIHWSQGVLIRIRLTGHRLKKDGQVGMRPDSATYPIVNGKVQQTPGHDFPVVWLQAIIDAHGVAPALRSVEEEAEMGYPRDRVLEDPAFDVPVE